MNIQITLPDGTVQTHKKGSTPFDVAKGISDGLARATIAAKVNDELVDRTKKLEKDCTLQLLTLKDEEGIYILRHSCAHTCAQAVKRLYPEALQTIGPVIEHGFYFDFDNLDISDEDLPKIEAEMKTIVKEKHGVTRKDYKNAQEAKADYKNNSYKIDLIEEHKEEGLSRYDQGEYHDLCRGPHAPDTSWADAFTLTHVAKAYWRGKSENKQLTRIYGLCFPKKKELNAHKEMLEQAKKRDHRKLAKELDLVMFHEHSPGAPFFLPKGAVMYEQLMELIRELYRARGYDEVITPLIYNKELFKTSGHWDHYRENMFHTTVEGQEFALKPMNCPSHCLLFQRDAHSYRDLPLRIADFAPLHRNELSGTLSGLTRVRKFSQDDAHIFCAPEQLEEELKGVMEFIEHIFTEVFKMEYHVELSTRPAKFMGEIALWDQAEAQLKTVLEDLQIKYTVNEGDGAFYGPKIDVHVKDAIGRSHQLSTNQVDFQMPQRFKLEYEGADGKKHTPVMVHRAIFGSFERFFGILVEHYEGKFPVWLSPEQVRVLPIADRHVAHAALVVEQCKQAGIRVTLDDRHLTTNKKVREAQLEQVNYILVVGDREVESKTVNVRTRDNEILGEKQVEEFIATVTALVQSRQ
ncbi:MAG: threonine--tRNA ligase [Candidatus Woesearchaeota archaeon]|nr:threonine--tRNA ligase [Candidatus Woesearchaeota archaeon]